MKVSEIFRSIQGEGRNQGRPSAFVRLAGCNLRCEWCDSKYAFEEGTEMSVDEILKHPDVVSTKHVVITGGEPLLQNIEPLVVELYGEWHTVEVETNGSLPVDESLKAFVHMNISPKMNGLDQDVLKKNASTATFKFVIKTEDDITWALNLTRANQLEDVYLMPEGTDRDTLLERSRMIADVLVKKYPAWNVKISPRLHVLMWGNKRGK